MALSFDHTGLYTSENHARAKARGLKTAGEAAAIIRSRTGKKVTAKLIRPFASEWHHSGFYNGKMGKTWFFTQSRIDELLSSIRSGSLFSHL